MHKKKIDFVFSILNILKSHIRNNLKEYLIVSVIFLIGIVLGVFVVNSINEEQRTQISNYINDFLNSLKIDYKIDNNMVLNKVLISNTLLIIVLWVVSMITIVRSFYSRRNNII